MSDQNVFLFIPNLIGYGRVIFALISFYYMPTKYVIAVVFYLLSGLLDAFDGWTARKYNQGTFFGAVLDMVTDRCATTCLILMLCFFYTRWIFLFQFLVALDISSHWIQMYSALLHGNSTHKVTDLAANPIMRWYYTRPVLFIFCAGNELFFVSLYLVCFTPGYTLTILGFDNGVWVILAVVCSPVSLLKQIVSVVQLIVACKDLARLDRAHRRRIGPT